PKKDDPRPVVRRFQSVAKPPIRGGTPAHPGHPASAEPSAARGCESSSRPVGPVALDPYPTGRRSYAPASAIEPDHPEAPARTDRATTGRLNPKAPTVADLDDLIEHVGGILAGHVGSPMVSLAIRCAGL